MFILGNKYLIERIYNSLLCLGILIYTISFFEFDIVHNENFNDHLTKWNHLQNDHLSMTNLTIFD